MRNFFYVGMHRWKIYSAFASVLAVLTIAFTNCTQKEFALNQNGNQNISSINNTKSSPVTIDPLINDLLYWPYLPSGNPAGHMDPACTNSTIYDFPTNPKLLMTLLPGYTVFTGAKFSPPDGKVYTTVSKKVGGPILYAFYYRDVFDDNGALLHRAGDFAWNNIDKGVVMDPGASVTLPVLDYEGNLYISDFRQAYSFSSEGQLRWKSKLPNKRTEISNLMGSFFTPQGDWAGVTTYGTIAIYDRKTGKLKKTFRLPGLIEMSLSSMIGRSGDGDPLNSIINECLWKNVDGSLMRDTLTTKRGWAALEGSAAPVSNGSPVLQDEINPNLIKIYTIGALQSTTNGVHDLQLFRTDLLYNPDKSIKSISVNKSFNKNTFIAGGGFSGSTPNISYDKSEIYVGDQFNNVYAFSTDSGALIWKREIGRALGGMTSKRPTHDERIFIGGLNNKLSLYDSKKQGKLAWTLDFNLTARNLSLASYPEISYPKVAQITSVTSSSPNHIALIVTFGYNIAPLTAGSLFQIWPIKSYQVLVDYGDVEKSIAGKIVAMIEVPDETDTGSFATPSGEIGLANGSMLSSTAYCLWQTQEVFKNLPEPARPIGGVSIYK
jgi:outer membrane protein assembly factor BamB